MSSDKIYKIVCKAKDYPNIQVRELTSGDSFVIMDRDNIVRPGDRYEDYPATISQILYEPRKWWEFWKKKKQLGFIVMWE